jgi:drug/metabolite transporter (DMT)-like permease
MLKCGIPLHGRDRMLLSRARRLGLAAVLLWSTASTAFELGLSQVPPFDLLFFSACVSLVALAVVALLRRRLPSVRMLLQAAPLGFLNPFLYYLVLLEAYDRLPAQVAMVVNYLWPMMLVLLGAALPGGRLRIRSLAAMAVSFLGVAVMALLHPGHGGGMDPAGLALALGSTVIWAAYWTFGVRLGGDPAARLTACFAWGVLFLGVVALLTGRPSTPGPGALAAAAWIGLFEMGVTYVVWLSALSASREPAEVGGLVYLTPFLSLAVIATVLREPVAPATLAGLVLVLAGIALQERWSGTGSARGAVGSGHAPGDGDEPAG